MGREFSINPVDNYPKAKTRPALHAKSAPVPGQGSKKGTRSTPGLPKDSFVSTSSCDADLHQADLLRRQSLSQGRQDLAHRAAQTKKATAQAPKNASGGKVKLSRTTVAARGLGTASGLVSVKQGYDKVKNGQVAEGSYNLVQGGVFTASEGRELYYASKGLKAPASTTGKVLGRANMGLTAGMAALDGKASCEAYKSGNTVEASERAGSAIINAVSAFPPTAIVGAVGGVLDYAAAKSGADEWMINKLNESQNRAYDSTSRERQYVAKMLLNTPTENLRHFNQKNRHQLAQGITGLRDMRQEYARRGDTRSVEAIDRQIGRIRQGLAGN